MTAKNSEDTEIEDFIDLTLSSSDSEAGTATESDDDGCPFNPPINISGNIYPLVIIESSILSLLGSLTTL